MEEDSLPLSEGVNNSDFVAFGSGWVVCPFFPIFLPSCLWLLLYNCIIWTDTGEVLVLPHIWHYSFCVEVIFSYQTTILPGISWHKKESELGIVWVWALWGSWHALLYLECLAHLCVQMNTPHLCSITLPLFIKAIINNNLEIPVFVVLDLTC